MTEINMNDTMTTIDAVANEALQQQAEKADKIRAAIAERGAYAHAAKGGENSGMVRQALKKFLATVPDAEVTKGADLVLRKELIPTADLPYVYTDDTVVLAWDANPLADKEGKRPCVVWVHVKRAPKAVKTLADKAAAFFTKRISGMTDELARSIINEVTWDEELTICPYPVAKPVALMSKERPGGRFILQDVDGKGGFIPNRPIGYVLENRVYLSLPGMEGRGRPWTFRLNPTKPVEEQNS